MVNVKIYEDESVGWYRNNIFYCMKYLNEYHFYYNHEYDCSIANCHTKAEYNKLMKLKVLW